MRSIICERTYQSDHVEAGIKDCDGLYYLRRFLITFLSITNFKTSHLSLLIQHGHINHT
jgi:hypothetical protein